MSVNYSWHFCSPADLLKCIYVQTLSGKKITLYILIFINNWASLLNWPNHPNILGKELPFWWSSLQMILTLKLEGQPYGEVKNKICWPSQSSYHPPNGLRHWQWCIGEDRLQMFHNCELCSQLIHFCLSLFSVLGLWTVQISVANFRCNPKRLVVIYIFMLEIKCSMICQSNIPRNKKKCFPKVSSF